MNDLVSVDVSQWLEDWKDTSTELSPDTYRRLFYEAYNIVEALMSDADALRSMLLLVDQMAKEALPHKRIRQTIAVLPEYLRGEE